MVEKGIALNLATAADLHIEIDEDVLANDAIISDGGASAEV